MLPVQPSVMERSPVRDSRGKLLHQARLLPPEDNLRRDLTQPRLLPLPEPPPQRLGCSPSRALSSSTALHEDEGLTPIQHRVQRDVHGVQLMQGIQPLHAAIIEDDPVAVGHPLPQGHRPPIRPDTLRVQPLRHLVRVPDGSTKGQDLYTGVQLPKPSQGHLQGRPPVIPYQMDLIRHHQGHPLHPRRPMPQKGVTLLIRRDNDVIVPEPRPPAVQVTRANPDPDPPPSRHLQNGVSLELLVLLPCQGAKGGEIHHLPASLEDVLQCTDLRDQCLSAGRGARQHKALAIEDFRLYGILLRRVKLIETPF
ncbi:hypothetical protein ES703_76913 [subsurface metagenome]